MNDAAAAATCAGLRAIALQQLDPAWISELPAPLVVQMRGSALGSRLLARTLAEGPAPALFAEPVWAMAPDVEWLFRSAAELDDVALDLAALALSALIRATVRRDTVLRLKRVLGEVRYALALNETSEHLDSIGFAKALAADVTLRRHFLAQGHAELIHYAGTIHPACAERIRLSLPPAQLPLAAVRLDSARVAAHLDRLRADECSAAAQVPEEMVDA